MFFKTNIFKILSFDRASNLQLKLVVVYSIYIHTIYINFFASIKRIIIMKFTSSICVEKGSSKICEQYACVIQTKIISCQQRKLKFCICINSSAIILPYVISYVGSLREDCLFFFSFRQQLIFFLFSNAANHSRITQGSKFIRRLGIIIV